MLRLRARDTQTSPKSREVVCASPHLLVIGERSISSALPQGIRATKEDADSAIKNLRRSIVLVLLQQPACYRKQPWRGRRSMPIIHAVVNMPTFYLRLESMRHLGEMERPQHETA
jgi:hypothetical protein